MIPTDKSKWIYLIDKNHRLKVQCFERNTAAVLPRFDQVYI